MAASSLLYGQQRANFRANVRDKNFEVGGFAGGQLFTDFPFRPMGGGNVTYAIQKSVLIYGEGSYFPGLEKKIATPSMPLFEDRAKRSLLDYNFGVHLRKRLPNSNIVPYVVAGVGGIHSPRSEQFAVEKRNGNRVTGFTPTTLPAQDKFALNYGAGLRWYFSENVGVRVELKGYRSSLKNFENFGRLTFAVFWQSR